MCANLYSGEPMQAEVECVNQTVENESENRKGGIAIFSEVKCRFPPSRKLFFGGIRVACTIFGAVARFRPRWEMMAFMFASKIQ